MAEPPVLEAAPADKAKAAEKTAKGDKAEKPKKGDKAKKAEGETAPAAGKKKLIIMIAAAVVVLGGAGAGAFFMFGGEPAGKTAETASKGKDKKAQASKGKKKAEKEEEKEAPPPEGPPLFVPLDPPFVVNFEAEEMVRFLQVTAQIMSRDPETVELLKVNDPIIRNDLLLLLGNQKYATIASREGKEALRNQSLEAVRKVVKSAGGKPKNVEAVYFTSFVMQ